MLIVHGDYKDLNYTGDFETIPPFEGEVAILAPFWERFKSGLHLSTYVNQGDWLSYVWIDIIHRVLPSHAYTSYGIIPAQTVRPFKLWNLYDERYADHAAHIFVTETLISHNRRDIPFPELKEMEIEYARMKMNRMALEKWKKKENTRWYL